MITQNNELYNRYLLFVLQKSIISARSFSVPPRAWVSDSRGRVKWDAYNLPVAVEVSNHRIHGFNELMVNELQCAVFYNYFN
jgi:hypothetical protein